MVEPEHYIIKGKGKLIKLSSEKILTVEDIIKIHDVMIEIGNRDENLDDSKILTLPIVLEDLVNKLQYKEASFLTKTAYIVYQLAYQHPFVQGNKRSAMMCSYIYLIKNDHKIPDEKIDEFTNIILQTAKYEIGVE
jgi:death-on-curing family protein